MDCGEMTSKLICQDFTPSDIAWSFAECVRISKHNDFRPGIVKLFEAEFNKIPEDVRKPFER